MSDDFQSNDTDGSPGADGDPESMVDFFSSEGVSASEEKESMESDDDDPSGSSERGPNRKAGKSKAKAKEPRSDEPEAPRHSEADADGGKADESYSRMVRNAAKQARSATAANQRIRELETRLSQAERTRQEPADVMDLIRGRLARDMGVQANDPRVREALFELSRDITLEHLGQAVDADPELKRLRSEREGLKRTQAERRALEDRIARIEQEKVEMQRLAERNGALGGVTQLLAREAESLPFLMAQTDVDPAGEIVDLILEAISTGQLANPTDDLAATRLVRRMARNLDSHYRQLAETLSSKLGRRADESADSDPDDEKPRQRLGSQDDARKGKRQGAPARQRGTTGAGGGGRGLPTPRQNGAEPDEDEDMTSWWKRQHELETARGSGRRR